MIESKNEASKNLEKALQALEQAKHRIANEKKKQNEKKRKAEKHHKYIVGCVQTKAKVRLLSSRKVYKCAPLPATLLAECRFCRFKC